MKIFVSAGESSGDLHGSELVQELFTLHPELKFTGLGGDKLKEAGVDILYHIKELATIGFTDVIKKYTFFKKVLNECSEKIERENPESVILIDYPGFNLRLAEKIKKFYKGKVIYYISPQLWAWHEKRVETVKKFVDKMLVVFPFETEFYRKHEVEAEYVGHPLVKRIKNFLCEYPKQKISSGERKTVTFLPGSRKDEIKLHLPVLIEIGNRLAKEFDVKINISKAGSLDDSVFEPFIDAIKDFSLTTQPVYELVSNSDLVLTKAGTSTMECGLIGTPFIIFYKTFAMNYHLLKRIVNVKQLGIVNILSGKTIVNEFIQKDFNADKILPEARRILTNENYSSEMKKNLNGLYDILGNANASENAARIISSYIN